MFKDSRSTLPMSPRRARISQPHNPARGAHCRFGSRNQRLCLGSQHQAFDLSPPSLPPLAYTCTEGVCGVPPDATTKPYTTPSACTSRQLTTANWGGASIRWVVALLMLLPHHSFLAHAQECADAVSGCDTLLGFCSFPSIAVSLCFSPTH
jgi:hypothetical protein